jgi:phage FluMu protein Com
MMELKVILDFACSVCAGSVNVILKCAGKGLTARTRTVAAVQIPCPNCQKVNQLYFEPNGTVRSVAPFQGLPHRWEPSVN